MRNIILISLLLISTGFAKTFSFTTQPDHNAKKLEKNYAKLATYLEKVLHVKVQFVPTTSYDDSIKAFAQKE